MKSQAHVLVFMTNCSLSYLGQFILFAFCFPPEHVQNFPCLYPVLLKHVPQVFDY